MNARVALLAQVHVMKTFVRPDGEARISIRDAIGADDVPTPYLEIARLEPDGSTRTAQAFHREELGELRNAIEQARRLLLGLEEPSADAAAQALVGVSNSRSKKRSRS